MRWLDAGHLSDNTTVIFMNDNGGTFEYEKRWAAIYPQMIAAGGDVHVKDEVNPGERHSRPRK